ncbi:uncharacterized protein (TIGR03089 family) [Allocatelliglobosispora scoriae]|uniref:Uncharacterized protein (TIGR03089 family) n=1 Tax=Allocatelliglobosispora scoriae TaxID=643052 RepID=A0A841C0I9_9ACTN|nr:TIGR03089 family protein [Allocatelliglobosispora scoriae]MBB5873376.1 uncharacterized protein (TIGR03089 family) [Allocatelliglobosispora scoriae]
MDVETAGVPALLAEGGLVGVDQPLLTFYDDATGERTALTAGDLGGWAARTAGLLRDGCGLGIGDRAAVMLHPHWQTAAVLLGCWSAGVAVSFRGTATAGLPALGGDAREPFDVSFVARDRLDDWLENVPDAVHQYALGPEIETLREPKGYYLDYLTEVARFPAEMPAAQVRPDGAATTDGTSYGAWGRLAAELASLNGLRPGDRVLVDAAEHEHPVKWLLAPLSVGATVVLVANLDPDRQEERLAAEGITRSL